MLAQQDSTTHLPTVIVNDLPIRLNDVGGTTIDSRGYKERILAYSLSEELSSSGLVYVKSGGIGGVSTISLRGSSASQTSVIWNGLPIESPMLGILDLSLLPSSLLDSWQIQKGGNASKWGSGAIGGAILMHTDLPESDTILGRFTSSIGSFGLFQQLGQLDYRKGRWSSRSKLFHHSSKNDFPIKTSNSSSSHRLSNSQITKSGLLQSMGIALTPRSEIEAHIWLQKSNVEIPPTLRQTSNLSFQRDQSIRNILIYRTVLNRAILTVKTAYFVEEQNYTDPALKIDSNYDFKSWLTDIDLTRMVSSSLRLNFAITHSRKHARSDNFGDQIIEHRANLLTGLIWEIKKLKVQFGLRQEVIEGNWAPLVPSVGMEYGLDDNWRLLFKVSRNYRYPTLNDFYWSPGGNPNLRAESGWNEEITLNFKSVSDGLSVEQDIGFFNRIVDDWIMWVPRDGSPFWSPMNIAKVWSRGLEYNSTVSFNMPKISLKLPSSIQVVRSTNEVSLQSPIINKGDQIFYSPEILGSLGAQLEFKVISFNYQHRWVGSVKGINQDVDAFNIGSFDVSWSGKIKGAGLNTNFRINNIWNIDYQLIEDRPMPGRHFQIGLSLTL
jgi:iron complex outermembrane receptor protein